MKRTTGRQWTGWLTSEHHGNSEKPYRFDCTTEIGMDFEACMAIWKNTQQRRADQGRRGSSGFLGPRTEQFALGSLYYLINYDFEVYGDRCLTEDPKEHGRKVVDLLQNMEFPKLDGDPLIDEIISKCWHNKYTTIAELAACTETLLGRSNCRETEAEKKSPPQWHAVIGRINRGLWKCFKSWWDFMLCRTSQTTKPEVTNGGNGWLCDGMKGLHTVKQPQGFRYLRYKRYLHYLSSWLFGRSLPTLLSILLVNSYHFVCLFNQSNGVGGWIASKNRRYPGNLPARWLITLFECADKRG